MGLKSSKLKVFMIDYNGRKKYAFGLDLFRAFNGVIPQPWKKYKEYGLVQEYSMVEYFKKGLK